MRLHFSACLALLGLTLSLQGAEPAKSVPEVPTTITAQHMEAVSNEKDNLMTALFTGDVVVKATNMTLSCERLEVVSIIKAAKDQVISKQERFKSMVATGRVKIIQGNREVTCGRAEVYPGEDRIMLTETPFLEDKDLELTYSGRNLYIYRGDQRIHGDDITITGKALKDFGPDNKSVKQSLGGSEEKKTK